MRFFKKKLLVACARALPALAAVLPSEGVRPDVALPERKQLLELGPSLYLPTFAMSRQLLILQRLAGRLYPSDFYRSMRWVSGHKP
jgi:hypothetical protein